MTAHTRVRVTDPAWEWIIQTAQQYGYVQAGCIKARGVHYFIEALSLVPHYYDARPVFMQTTDQWYTGLDMPRERLLALDPSTITRLVILARIWRIYPYPTQQPIIKGLRERMPPKRAEQYQRAARVAPVLEAIGLRWLRPASSPSVAHNLRYIASDQREKNALAGLSS